MKLILILILVFMVLESCDKSPFKKNNNQTYLIPPKYVWNDTIYLGISLNKLKLNSDYKYMQNEEFFKFATLERANNNNSNVFFNESRIIETNEYVNVILLKQSYINNKIKYIQKSIFMIKELIKEYGQSFFLHKANEYNFVDSSMSNKDLILLGIINSDSSAYISLQLYDLNKIINTNKYDSNNLWKYFMHISAFTKDKNVDGLHLSELTKIIGTSDKDYKKLILDSLDIWEKRFVDSNGVE